MCKILLMFCVLIVRRRDVYCETDLKLVDGLSVYVL